MKSSILAFSAATALTLGACTSAGALPSPQEAGARSDLQAYPAATAGQTRHVIRLPSEGDEDGLKVELIVGRTLEVDCNRQMLGGSIDTRTAEGWGYDYFVVSDLGQSATTLMACPDNTRRSAFVRGGGAPTLIRYNSRLPVVVYTPSNVELRYRIWRAGPERTPS
jgi:ecotin